MEAKPEPSKKSQPASRRASQDKVLVKRGYNIGNYLGEGSYSQVYQAEYSDPKKEVNKRVKLACKIVNTLELSKDFYERFFPREMSILNEVRHPNVVRVHSILKRKQLYYIFMEFAEHGDLLHFILANGAIKEPQSRNWFNQIIRGLKYLHDKNIAHRDMKCENLLLTSGFNIKISDFGFARYCNLDGSPTFVETYCGSVTYVAPEILRGQPYDPKLSDIWSLGIILYIMLNKAWPFDPTNPKKLYEAQKAKNWKIRSKVEHSLTHDVKNFLHLLLEPEPSLRLSLDQMRMTPWFLSSLASVTSKSKESDKKVQQLEVLSPPQNLGVGQALPIVVHGNTAVNPQHYNDHGIVVADSTANPGDMHDYNPTTDNDVFSHHEPTSNSVTIIETRVKEHVENNTIIVPRSKKEGALDPPSHYQH